MMYILTQILTPLANARGSPGPCVPAVQTSRRLREGSEAQATEYLVHYPSIPSQCVRDGTHNVSMEAIMTRTLASHFTNNLRNDVEVDVGHFLMSKRSIVLQNIVLLTTVRLEHGQ